MSLLSSRARTEATIREAIVRWRLLEFRYDGHSRIVEPHTLGYLTGTLRLLGYQVGGSSSSGRLPEWRLFTLEKIGQARLTDRPFAGPRRAETRPAKLDQIVVQIPSRPQVPRDAAPDEDNRQQSSVVRQQENSVNKLVPDDQALSTLAAIEERSSMLDADLVAVIRNGVLQRMPQARREFAEAISRDLSRNIQMGRNGGIALFFPKQTAGAEIDRRMDFAWEHAKAVLAAGAVPASDNLVSDVDQLMEGLREDLLKDVHASLAEIADRNSSASPEKELQSRWAEGMGRIRAAAEVYGLALQRRAAGQTASTPGVLLQGTIHSAVIQTGTGAVANVQQSITTAEIEQVERLLDRLLSEIGERPDDEGSKPAVLAVVQHLQQQAKDKKVTTNGLAAALTFILSTWKSLKDLGVLVPLRAWLAVHGHPVSLSE